MNERIRNLMEKRSEALQKARAMLDKAAQEERDLTNEEQAQYDGWDGEIDQYSRQIDREQKLEEREDRARMSANGQNNPVMNRQPGGAENADDEPTDTRDYRQSVIRYLVNGQNDGVARFDHFGGEIRSIQGISITGDGATGGVLAPAVMEKALLDFNKDYNVMRRLATVRSSNSDVDIPYTATHTQAYHIAEGADFTASTPAWAKVTMKAYKAGALTIATHEAMQDMFIDLENWIRDDFGMAFADLEENDFVNGTGSGQPTGFLADATSAGTTASATAFTGDELIDLIHAVDRKYRERGVFVMSDSALKAIRKVKTGDGQYLWQPGLTAGAPDRLLGYALYTCAKMPAATAGNKAIAFGDFRQYRILDRRGLYIQRLNELYATSGQVGFLAYRRYDGKLLKTDAVKVLTMHA